MDNNDDYERTTFTFYCCQSNSLIYRTLRLTAIKKRVSKNDPTEESAQRYRVVSAILKERRDAPTVVWNFSYRSAASLQ